jgi:hypothetical protein
MPDGTKKQFTVNITTTISNYYTVEAANQEEAEATAIMDHIDDVKGMRYSELSEYSSIVCFENKK